MKHSIRGSIVVLAIVVSFVLAQGAWAGPNIVELEGTVTAVHNCSIELDTGDTIYHIGPKWYWKEWGLSYPDDGMYLKIKAYDSSSNGYVAVSVCYIDYLPDSEEPIETCIDLRNSETLQPLWIQHPETTDLLSGCLEGGDCEPVDNHWDKDYDNSYQSKGPHKKPF